jgi:ribonuclease HI
MSIWNVFFDGLCEPVNPGGVMAWGYVIDPQNGDLIREHGAMPANPANTNNVAEYYALGHAVRHVNDMLAASEQLRGKFAGLHIRGDSKLVVEQVNGKWAVKAARLAPLHGRILELLRRTGQPWQIEWVPREQNELADVLSRRGYAEMTGKQPPLRGKVA